MSSQAQKKPMSLLEEDLKSQKIPGIKKTGNLAEGLKLKKQKTS